MGRRGHIDLFARLHQLFDFGAEILVGIHVAVVDIVARKDHGVGLFVGKDLFNKGVQNLRRGLQRDLVAPLAHGEGLALDPGPLGHKMGVCQQIKRRFTAHVHCSFLKRKSFHVVL